MHIVIGAVLVIVLLGVYLYIADKRKKEQRAREEQLRREKIINRLNDISREMINDNRFQSLFQHLDGIMTPQEQQIYQLNYSRNTQIFQWDLAIE